MREAAAETAIEIKNVSKVYHLYPNARARLKEILNPFHGWRKGKVYHQDYYALQQVSFRVARQGCVGIIGTNGAGKSTLLKIISQVLSPTDGTVFVAGKVAAILELGAGFHPEYTGRENIRLQQMLQGCDEAKSQTQEEEIIAFAGIGTYIDQPVKTYSSGMYARLAFAVSIHTDPDILIVDEALSVGDIAFQEKCYRKMQEMKASKTVLLVTHDMGAVVKFCDRVIWLDKGKIKRDGKPFQVVKEYQAWLHEAQLQKQSTSQKEKEMEETSAVKTERMCAEREQVKPFKGDHSVCSGAYTLEKISASCEEYGTKEVCIEAVGLFREGEFEPIHVLQGSEQVVFVMKVHKNEQINDPIAGLTVTDRLGTQLFSMNSYIKGMDVYSEMMDDLCICHFMMPCLNAGHYCISPAYAKGSQASHTMLHWVYDAFIFQVIVPFAKTLEGILAITDFTYCVEACGEYAAKTDTDQNGQNA